MAKATDIVPAGEILEGKYRIGERIAVGSMSVVVAARHMQLDEPVAIKILQPNLTNPRFTARFVREARNAARIKSEFVPRFFDVGWLSGGLPYLVMEYLEGETLARKIESRREIRVPDAVDYVIQACEAVAAAHMIGILHRDLKPGNLFLTSRLDGTPVIKVLDFGISRVRNSSGEREDEGLTVADVTLGSNDFKAPEQFAGHDMDARCDVWALGAILYNLVTLRQPFVGQTSRDVIKNIFAGGPRPPSELRPEIPPDLESAILRCLQGDPNSRPESVAKLALFLQAFGSERTRGIPDSILKAQRRARRLSEDNGRELPFRDVAAPVFADEDSMRGRDSVITAMPRPVPSNVPIASRHPRSSPSSPPSSMPRVVMLGLAGVMAGVFSLLVARRVMTRPRVEPVTQVNRRDPNSTSVAASDPIPAVSEQPIPVAPTAEPSASAITATQVPTAPTLAPQAGAPGSSPGATTAAPRAAAVSSPVSPPHGSRVRPRPVAAQKAAPAPSSGSAADPWGWDR
jgi:serine/threonine protein kinase